MVGRGQGRSGTASRDRARGGARPGGGSPRGDAGRCEGPPGHRGQRSDHGQVGGDRQDDGQIAGRRGVSLQLLAYDGDSTPGPPVNTSWSTCTSDSRGDCSFVVPDTHASQSGTPAGANRNTRFWVTQVSAPAGWLTNPTLRTGTATSAESTAQPYRFLTGPELHAGNTYRSGTSFMTTVSGSTAEQRKSSGGIWQQSRDNPGPPSACGLDVALILDLSGSVGDQIGALRGKDQG